MKVDAWALVVAVLAFVVAGAALVIAWWQLVLQRDVAGGRGIIFGVSRYFRTVARKGDVETLIESYVVEVGLIGNDRHMVAVHLERDGERLGPADTGWVESPPVVPRMTCESDPIEWHFALSPEAARDLWVVLSWVSPYRDGVRTDGFRRRLVEPEFDEWHWFRTYRARLWLESWALRRRWGWLRRRLGTLRLGEWRPWVARELQPGQSPFNSKFPVVDGD